ncbi:hypothetical protein GOV13_03745 [Candidatus Pacearchaeota archaeon]|nr:hypothetical protein [Candidatus Pacearchaeota archaeon]
MIELLKKTYLLKPEDIEIELDKHYKRYQEILNRTKEIWEDMNEARAILFLTGQVYCEQIAPQAIERRLHLLKEKMELVKFFELIDSNSEQLEELRKDSLFVELEKFYRIIKEYKNKYDNGKFYLDEERFIKVYNLFNPDPQDLAGYKGEFDKKSLDFMK